MGDWPILSDGGAKVNYGTTLATTLLTTVTASASANTKGAWAEIIATTICDCKGFWVQMGAQNTAKEYLVDLGIGAAGSEIVLVSDILFGSLAPSTRATAQCFFIPISIPAGTRISCRCQCATGSATLSVGVISLGPGFMPSNSLGKCETYGAVEATSLGSTVDPGTSANTKGAYTQMTAATGIIVRELIILLGSNNAISHSNGSWLIDVAIGAAGSEIVSIPNLFVVPGFGNGMGFVPSVIGPIPVNYPVGTRIAVRAQSTVTLTADRKFDCVIIGVG